ncbi:Lsr2 family DNA-binding protein [Mycobacterium gordonae]|uniref:Lsr2 family DNA-binding protein n=1 Tax=Mycobacterium gordonae TaxID=1778 RepID=UPI000A3FD8FF
MDLPVPRRHPRLGDHRKSCPATRFTHTLGISELDEAPASPAPPTAQVRAWARNAGLPVPDRGRLRPEIWTASHDANPPNQP